jgi:hypothetical protein
MAQLLQALSNPMAPPELQHFLGSFALSSTYLMRRIAKDFGVEDPSAAVPDLLDTIKQRVAAIEQQLKRNSQQPGTALGMPGGGGQPQLPPPGQAPPPQMGGGGGGGMAPVVQPEAQQLLREVMPNDRPQ